MFTGIVEGTGRVLKIESRRGAKRLTIQFPSHLTEVQLGDSININGVCLTVVEKRDQNLTFDLSMETIKRSALGELREGDSVNFERALRFNGRFGGHFVTGHIDGVGIITEIRKERDFVNLKVRIPDEITTYVVPKGSIAIDGVSLTVNEYKGNEISLILIPYTLEKTTLMDKRPKDSVNLEADILAKYVERLLSMKNKEARGVDLLFLKEHGFLKGDDGSDA